MTLVPRWRAAVAAAPLILTSLTGCSIGSSGVDIGPATPATPATTAAPAAASSPVSSTAPITAPGGVPRVLAFVGSSDLVAVMPTGYRTAPELQAPDGATLSMFVSDTYGSDLTRSELDQTIIVRPGDEVPAEHAPGSGDARAVAMRCPDSDIGPVQAWDSSPGDGINNAVTVSAPGWSVQVLGHYVETSVLDRVASDLVCAGR